VRIGKRIELYVAGEVTEADKADAAKIAESFLSNGVIEDVVNITVEELGAGHEKSALLLFRAL
jgi:phosphoribosylformylglycinamidine synthase